MRRKKIIIQTASLLSLSACRNSSADVLDCLFLSIHAAVSASVLLLMYTDYKVMYLQCIFVEKKYVQWFEKKYMDKSMISD